VALMPAVERSLTIGRNPMDNTSSPPMNDNRYQLL
jgi:hypothetical protein